MVTNPPSTGALGILKLKGNETEAVSLALLTGIQLRE